jgi:peptide/nickel transport system permease protein
VRQRLVTGLVWGLGIGAALCLGFVVSLRLLQRHLTMIAPAAVWRRRGLWTIGFLTVVAVVVAVVVGLSAGYHILGTDKAGQDVLYMALKSVRTGLVIGTLTTLIVTPFAILFGVLAGYFGGPTDDIIQYVYTTLSSIPDILLIAAAMLIFQVGLTAKETILSADERLVYLCIIMGITSWTGLCRLIRAEVLKLREIEYVQAADAFGVARATIMFRHLVPNVLHIVLISVILRFSGLVLAEAVLAYVGIGVDPSMQSWGNMINQARLELAREPVVWWSLLAAFVFMLGLVLPANVFGDAVRDALDPRLRTQ